MSDHEQNSTGAPAPSTTPSPSPSPSPASTGQTQAPAQGGEMSQASQPQASAQGGEMSQASQPQAPAQGGGFPSHETFGWDSWDGSSFDAFPEPVRPWAEQLHGRYKEELDQAAKEVARYKASTDAFLNGWEDPAVNEVREQLAEREQALALAEQRYQNLEQQVEAEREQQDQRYYAWVQETKQATVEKAKEVLGGQAREAMLKLGEAGYDLHVALDIGTFGIKAVEDAVAFADRFAGQDDGHDLALELLEARYGVKQESPPPNTGRKLQSPPPEAPQPKASESDEMVTGARPARQPRQIQTQTKASRFGDRRDKYHSIADKYFK